MCVFVTWVRHSPGRRQSRSAGAAGWGLSCCRLSSASVRATSSARQNLERCSVLGRPEKRNNMEVLYGVNDLCRVN